MQQNLNHISRNFHKFATPAVDVKRTLMVSKTTHKIKISVEVMYDAPASIPFHHAYSYNYGVHIENFSGNPVIIIGRHLVLFDSILEKKGAYTPDVAGENPTIEDYYYYTSSCTFRSPAGKLTGELILQDKVTNEIFKIDFPVIQFEYPGSNN